MKNFGLAALLSAVASCYSLAAPGGTPGVAEDLSGDYYFKNISMQQGLSHTTVTSIIQDRRGFIWFGTHNGLNRFDGKMFRIYNSGNSDLERNFTSGLMEDSSGRLWVGTDDGIFLYNPDTDKIDKYQKGRNRVPLAGGPGVLEAAFAGALPHRRQPVGRSVSSGQGTILS